MIRNLTPTEVTEIESSWVPVPPKICKFLWNHDYQRVVADGVVVSYTCSVCGDVQIKPHNEGWEMIKVVSEADAKPEPIARTKVGGLPEFTEGHAAMAGLQPGKALEITFASKTIADLKSKDVENPIRTIVGAYRRLSSKLPFGVVVYNHGDDVVVIKRPTKPIPVKTLAKRKK